MEVKSVTVGLERFRESWVQKWQQISGDAINLYMGCCRKRSSFEEIFQHPYLQMEGFKTSELQLMGE